MGETKVWEYASLTINGDTWWTSFENTKSEAGKLNHSKGEAMALVNNFAREGWELVTAAGGGTVNNYTLFFKRRA